MFPNRLGWEASILIARLISPAVAASLLSACATQHEQQWYRAGASQQDFAMDQGQCQAQGFGISGATLLQTAVVFNSCMRGKGWELRSAEQMPAAPPATLQQPCMVGNKPCTSAADISPKR